MVELTERHPTPMIGLAAESSKKIKQALRFTTKAPPLWRGFCLFNPRPPHLLLCLLNNQFLVTGINFRNAYFQNRLERYPVRRNSTPAFLPRRLVKALPRIEAGVQNPPAMSSVRSLAIHTAVSPSMRDVEP